MIRVPGLAALASLFVSIASAPTGSGQTRGNVEDQIPLIQFESVPLDTAIENLARQAELNYIRSAKIPNQTITRRMENMSARSALTNLLATYKLFLVENPATTVAHISATNRIVFSVDAKWIAADTNEILPLIQFQEVPLDVALTQTARQAGIQIKIDPEFTRDSPLSRRQPLSEQMVSVRWTHLKLRQAIAALCENYHLALLNDANSSSIRIKPK